MAANMYRVGDYVYFETSSTSPFQIRRIEELNKTPNGNVEAKVMCFYRRRDISSSLIVLADKHQTDALDSKKVYNQDRDEVDMDVGDEEEDESSPPPLLQQQSPQPNEEQQQDKQSEKQSDKQSDKESDKQPDKESDKQPDKESDKHPDKQSDKQPDKQTDKQSEKQPDKQSEKQPDKQSEKQPDKESDKQTEKQTGSEQQLSTSTTETSMETSSDKADNKSENSEKSEKNDKSQVTEKQRHQLKHRELFLSRQVETLPATHIRGKCVVTLLNETESLLSYLNKEDTFFYSLVYDPQQKTLLADKGEIRVGSKFQAEITPLLKEGEKDGRVIADLEDLIWQPDNGLAEKEVDQFNIISRSVGTFARALDCTSTVRQPSLHMSAAAASRDITLFHAMCTLHKHNYDLAKAVASLVPEGGPVLCRDEMEEWSASEANLFEEALDKYGKDFNDIRQDFLPWKSLKSIIEYYYMWKTTDRYVQQKRIKAAEAESKLKQVYIPNYNKPNPAALSNKMNGADGQVSGRACESCYTAHSSQWYSWGPSHLQCRLCSCCWSYWKKYGGLKMPTRLGTNNYGDSLPTERVAQMNAIRSHRCTISGCGKDFKLKAHLARHLATAHGLAIRSGSPRPVMKTRAAFCLVTTPLTRISRRLCKDILRPRHAARCPFIPINIAAIKQECSGRVTEVGKIELPTTGKIRGLTMEPVVCRLGIDTSVEKPSLLSRKSGEPRGEQRISFPAPPHPPPHRIPETIQTSTAGPSIMKKRGYEQSNGIDIPPSAKRPSLGVIRQVGSALRTVPTIRGSVINHSTFKNGRSKTPGVRGGYKMHMISWIDAPDDVYFVATEATRKLRHQISHHAVKRAARNPWRGLLLQIPMPTIEVPRPEHKQEVVVLD
ncbi:metastasis-associated protein MTA3-like isoform X4 [Haliotis rubra]|uniref:metastasis-associated protein MTA3-like isoform X4 n=1 Tax=Haliotis rubra TaxID=36100 RepID=UPI001EE5D283|nr:metastasis-associated protein MTA3-like isoform X4 [Haliotis rubra]